MDKYTTTETALGPLATIDSGNGVFRFVPTDISLDQKITFTYTAESTVGGVT